jgi:serine/threonine protein kinase
MPDANDPSPIIDPRLGSMLISATDHPDATGSSAPGAAAALTFGPPAAAGELGTLGPYRVVRELGRGAMGAVCLAVDTRLDRQLALKVMLPEFAADAEAKARFLREARAAAKITHDNVVTVYEADERDGVPYIAMQLLQGLTLDAFLQKKGTPSLRHAVRIAREAALGLAAAHKLGIVHRDIKPANLWLEAPNGRVKLLDFGLARPDSLDTELTKSGVLIGTPAFMSPEQALGERVDHRTDLFSLGAVLYWLCTGQLPFPGATVVAMLKALGTEEPKPVLALNPKVPGPLAELIHRLLAKAPEGRPQSATEVTNRLHEILEQSAGLSAAVPAGGSGSPAGAQTGDPDPWATTYRSATSQQAGPAPMVPGEPNLLRSMRAVAITPTTQPEEPQKPAPGPMRTVLSSGVLWEEGEEGTEEAKRPIRPTRQVQEEEEEEEQRDRPTRRSAKRRAKGKNASAMGLYIGVGAVVLIGAVVAVALVVPRGKSKETNSAELGTGNRTELPDKGREQPKAPTAPNTSTTSGPAPSAPAPSPATPSLPEPSASAPSAPTPPKPEVTPLLCFWDKTLNEHIYTYGDGEPTNWRKNPAFTTKPTVGYVATKQYPDTARLYRAYSRDRLHYFYLDKPAGARDIERIEDFVVYVWTKPGDGRVPVHACFLPNDKDAYFEQDLDRVKDYVDGTLKGIGKRRKLVENYFYVYPTGSAPK